MLSLLKRIWHYLALIAGAALIGFEISKPGPVSGESLFWIVVGALVVVLATVDIVQRRGNLGKKTPENKASHQD